MNKIYLPMFLNELFFTKFPKKQNEKLFGYIAEIPEIFNVSISNTDIKYYEFIVSDKALTNMLLIGLVGKKNNIIMVTPTTTEPNSAIECVARIKEILEKEGS